MRSASSIWHWVAAAFLAVAAAWLTVVPGPPTPVDRSLPLLALIAVVLAAFASGKTWRLAPAAGVPLLIATAISVPDSSMRVLLYGVIMAALVLLAVAGNTEGDCVPTGRAACLVATVVALLHLVGLRPGERIADLIVIGSAALLVLVLSFDGVVSPVVMAIAIAAGEVVPFHPGRSSLVLLGVVLALWFLRAPRVPVAVLALLVGLVAGWYPLAMVLLVMAAGLLSPNEDESSMVALPAGGLMGGALPPLLFHPRLLADLTRLDLGRGVAAALLLASAFAVRPEQAAIAVIVAAAIVAGGRPRTSSAGSLPPLIFMTAIVALFGWSGVTAAQFPIPLPLAALAIISILALIPAIPRIATVSGLAGMVAVIVIASFWPPREVSIQGEQRALRAGESDVMRPSALTRSVSLVLSGANLSGLRRGTKVGAVEVVDDAGHGWRRDLSIGEVVDWGGFRREERFFSPSPLPRDSAGKWIDFGERAFVDGKGRVTMQLNRPIVVVAVRAAPDLPASATLLVDRLELAP